MPRAPLAPVAERRRDDEDQDEERKDAVSLPFHLRFTEPQVVRHLHTLLLPEGDAEELMSRRRGPEPGVPHRHGKGLRLSSGWPAHDPPRVQEQAGDEQKPIRTAVTSLRVIPTSAPGIVAPGRERVQGEELVDGTAARLTPMLPMARISSSRHDDDLLRQTEGEGLLDPGILMP